MQICCRFLSRSEVLFECEPTDNISLNSLIIVPYAVLHCLSDDNKQVLFSRIKFLIKLSVYFFSNINKCQNTCLLQ